MNRMIPILILIFVFSESCKHRDSSSKISEELLNENLKEYIHISHTRIGKNPHLISEVEELDYSKYDMTLLGGDLTWLSSKDDDVMTHLDAIFDLSNENTLWSLGNHDYTDRNRITKFTKRPSFYAKHLNGLTFLVLDTQDNLSSITGKQLELVKAVSDTLENTSHLILLHHKLIWMQGNPDLESRISAISNGKAGDCSYCLNPNNFYTDIYPVLLEVKKKGIEVICVGGDIGKKVNKFEYKTPEDIYFLASGLSEKADTLKALIFSHDIANKELTWRYQPLSEL